MNKTKWTVSVVSANTHSHSYQLILAQSLGHLLEKVNMQDYLWHLDKVAVAKIRHLPAVS
jgi:hypothetical protein